MHAQSPNVSPQMKDGEIFNSDDRLLEDASKRRWCLC